MHQIGAVGARAGESGAQMHQIGAVGTRNGRIWCTNAPDRGGWCAYGRIWCTNAPDRGGWCAYGRIWCTNAPYRGGWRASGRIWCINAPYRGGWCAYGRIWCTYAPDSCTLRRSPGRITFALFPGCRKKGGKRGEPPARGRKAAGRSGAGGKTAETRSRPLPVKRADFLPSVHPAIDMAVLVHGAPSVSCWILRSASSQCRRISSRI